MTNVSLQVICSFLVAIGLFFILLDLRTRFDRSFRFFGISLIILCMMSSIDIWIIPKAHSMKDILLWQKLYHCLSILYVPFSLWYLSILTKSSFLKSVPSVFIVASLLMAAFLQGMMIVPGKNDVETTLAYNILFLPYVLFYVVMAPAIILKRINKCPPPEKRILRFHLAGFAMLMLGGLLDLGVFVGMIHDMMASFTVIGVMVFGTMASLIFSERFLQILREKQSTFEKLESAYRDLEQVNALKQLGESTAIINHEIKNYMFMISGNAQVLGEMENLSQKGKDIVTNIVTSVERLNDFSDDILKLSRTHVMKEKHPVNLTELIRGVIEKHYATRRSRFTLQGFSSGHFMFGDWGKLEQVFVNVFNNSLEAGQGNTAIEVKITQVQGLLLVSVDDNGAGCDEEGLESLFKAFYTTKKTKGGTGLGMSITRTIVEGHGGKISAYSKNLAKRGSHGLKLIMTFPMYEQNMAQETSRKHPIVLIKEGMENLADLIQVFQNVRVTPHILQNTGDLNESDFPPESHTVIVNAATMAANFTRLAAYPRLCLVSHHKKNLYILDYGRGNMPDVFSEEYVLSRLLRKVPQRARIRERQALLSF